jgi:predicted component of type VI protein secretion system
MKTVVLAGVLLLAACVSTRSATDDRSSATESSRRVEAERATNDTRTEGPVTVTTTVVELADMPSP